MLTSEMWHFDSVMMWILCDNDQLRALTIVITSLDLKRKKKNDILCVYICT